MATSFELRPFQVKAVNSLLKNLKNMKQEQRQTGKASWTCLKAPTGAGKTVMAAALIDELLNPKSDSVFSDKDSVILWVCEKSLLSQSRSKLDRFLESDMPGGGSEIVNEAGLRSISMFKKGKVYFIETQLLGDKKRISSETEENGGNTFWKILEKTVENAPVYCFIDEAHRGFNSKPFKPTVREQIIRSIPFVIGISATEDNFVSFMNSTKRLNCGVVEVSPQEVRESGLLKENVYLYVPARNASGTDKYDLYLELALDHFRTSIKAWHEYHSENKYEKSVAPLLVVQLEAKSQDDISGDEERGRIEGIVNTIKSKIPNLPSYGFAHVLSNTPDLPVAGTLIRHVSPEEVQNEKSIQILFAKEAISNGWDCPRAEVLYSRARRTDPTYIAQFLGRMMRTPLGRKVENNQELNSVSAMLPLYDEKTVNDVVKYLTDNSAESSENVEINPIEIPLADPKRNYSTFEPAIWRGLMDAVEKIRVPMPTLTPKSLFHFLQDTFSLIAESGYALRSEVNALQDVDESFYEHVRIESLDHKYEREKFLDDLKTGVYKVGYDVKTQDTETVLADLIKDTDGDIGRKARETKNVFTLEFVNAYLRRHSDIESEKNLLFAARDPVLSDLKEWAKQKQKELWDSFAVSVVYDDLSLSEKEKYDKIAEEGAGISGKAYSKKFVLNRCMSEQPNDPGYEKCIYQGEDGLAHLHLNKLESECVEKYLYENDTIAFFRNPPHGNRAFKIFKDNGELFYPDFIFFEMRHDEIRPYVVDPHGLQFEDSLSRLKGAVNYLKQNPGVFSGWFAIDGEGKPINLTDPSTQERVEKAKSASQLYLS